MGDPARERDAAQEARARREALRQRLADQGLTVHIPPAGKTWHPPQPLPFTADELSDAVIRMRRGDV